MEKNTQVTKKASFGLSRLLFKWYYKRCGDFFGKWPFRKSVKLLIANYNHLTKMYEGQQEVLNNALKEIDRLRKDLSDLRIKQIAPDGVIDWANKSLGANIRKDSEN